MSLTVNVTRDDISKDLRAKLAKVKNLAPVWRAVGTQVISIATRSFREPALRITPWAAKKTVKKNDDGSLTWGEGGPSNLIRKGTLKMSLRLITVSTGGVTIGSDRVYAAIHQLGGVIRPKAAGALSFSIGGVRVSAKKVTMPARPFLPFEASGQLSPKHQPKVLVMVDKAVQKQIGLSS